MGNSILIRREGEMSHLGDIRWQQLRSSPFAPIPLFHSQLMKDGEEFLLKKDTLKNTQGFKPHHNQKKEATSGNPPMGTINKQ